MDFKLADAFGAPGGARTFFGALALLAFAAASCTTAAAETTGPVAAPVPGETVPGETVLVETAPEQLATPDATQSLDGLVHDTLVQLGEIGYYGACPTVESLGLDPLSSDTPSALAEVVERHHCSWTIAETPAGVTLNLDRLDVFGDEALYYLAIVQEQDGWRLASVPERAAVGSELIGATAVYLDDLLPT